MNIKINLDNLDDAIQQIAKLETQMQSFTVDVTEEARLGVSYPNVSVKHNGSGSHTIIAEGWQENEIAFLEFGAGYVADTKDGFPEFGGDEFHTEPGIWSASHMQTFQKHQASGKAPSTYRYNRVPQNKMQRAAQKLVSNTAQKAREYFK